MWKKFSNGTQTNLLWTGMCFGIFLAIFVFVSAVAMESLYTGFWCIPILAVSFFLGFQASDRSDD